jgi:hypothetical protein
MKKTIEVARIPTTTDQVISVEVYYTKGGMSYATYKTMERGYYLGCMPVKYDLWERGEIRTSGIFTGNCIMLEAANRFNAKRLRALADTVLDGEYYNRCMAILLARHADLKTSCEEEFFVSLEGGEVCIRDGFPTEAVALAWLQEKASVHHIPGLDGYVIKKCEKA